MTQVTFYINRLSQIKKTGIVLREIKTDMTRLSNFLAPTYLLRHADNPWLSNSIDCVPTPVIHRPIQNDIKNAEVILILGSNDLDPPKLAAKLYQQIAPHNPSVKLIASGKGGHLTVPGTAFTVAEAEKYKEELLALGVPEENVLTEPTSTNSGQNITFSGALLEQMDLHPTKIIIIQTPALQLRANLAFERQWKGNWDYYLSLPPKTADIKTLSLHDADFLLAAALRELMTLISYSGDPHCNFVTKRAIPDPLINIALKYFALLNAGRQQITRDDFSRNIKVITQLFRDTFQDAEKQWLNK